MTTIRRPHCFTTVLATAALAAIELAITALTCTVLAALTCTVLAAPAAAQVLPPVIVPPGGGDEVPLATFTGLWRPAEEVEVRYATTLGDFVAAKNDLFLAGWQLFDFERRLNRWTGVWREHDGAGDPDHLLLDIDSADLVNTMITQRGLGYELVDLELRVVGGTLEVDAVFHPGVPMHTVDLGVQTPQIPGLIDEMAINDYSLVDVEFYYDVAGQGRWALVWSDEVLDTTFEVATPGTPAAENLSKNEGRQPIDLEPFIDGETTRWAGVWAPLSDDDYVYGSRSLDLIQTKIAALANAGGGGGSVIWVNNPKYLIDLDIDRTHLDTPVMPQPLDHDGPINPGGP